MYKRGWLSLAQLLDTLSDYFIVGNLLGLIVFAPGAFLPIIDAFLWAGLTALAITVMPLASGPAQNRPTGEQAEIPFKPARTSEGRPP